MCELTLEQAGLSGEKQEISSLPTRKTWYGIVGGHKDYQVPDNLTDDRELAFARAKVSNTDLSALGPWHVVVLTENLHVQS